MFFFLDCSIKHEIFVLFSSIFTFGSIEKNVNPSLQRLDMYRLKARIGFTDHVFYESDKILKDLYKTHTFT